MIGELIDRAVSVISPESAVKRAHARNVYQNVVKRRYEAAKTDRTNSHWRTANQSADLELQDSADIIRSRSRALVRDNAYARGVIKTFVRNVVGCGITLQSRYENEPTAEAIEGHWNRWQQRADISGRLSFNEMQALAYMEVLEAGEVLIRFVQSSDRRRNVPLALEMVEADRFSDDQFIRGFNPETGNEVRRGVELNSEGQAVTYWLYDAHPNGVNSWRQETKPYPAGEFLHLYRQERVGQTRGVSIFAPVLAWLQKLGYYVDNEMQSSAVASCFTAVVTTLAGEADGGLLDTTDDSATDTDGNRFEYIQPGLVARLMPGESLQTVNPARGHVEAAVWIDLMLHAISVGTGISYERLARDYSKTNYSSNRASDLEDRREFRPQQSWLESHLCVPVFDRWFAYAVDQRLDGMPEPVEYVIDQDEYTAQAWQKPGFEWVDPVKEEKASADSITDGLSTLEIEIGKKGLDWKDVSRQRAREESYQAELRTEFGLPEPVIEDTPEPVGAING